jgi:protein-S-isoprenylcysteine O-methyltransferase Ste14
MEFPVLLSIVGLTLLAVGTLLHIWAASLLSLPGIIGIQEISKPQRSKLMDQGPFTVVRHPTYLAHTMMFIGMYFITGVTAVGILTLVDFVVVNAVVIPFEEKELLQRFGEPYRKYMTVVPRMIPRISRKG